LRNGFVFFAHAGSGIKASTYFPLNPNQGPEFASNNDGLTRTAFAALKTFVNDTFFSPRSSCPMYVR